MVYVFTFPRFQAEEVTTAFFFGVVWRGSDVGVHLRNENGCERHHIGLVDFSELLDFWIPVPICWEESSKHKMAPVLSPKKSIEGATIGGVVGAGIFGLIFGFLFQAPARKVFRISVFAGR